MSAPKLTTVKCLSLPRILFAKWTSQTVHVLHERPYAPGALLSEVLAFLALVVALVNTPALQHSNEALLTVVNSQAGQQELTGPSHIRGASTQAVI